MVVCGLAAFGAPASAVEDAAAGAVRGYIVRLKDAPAHAHLLAAARAGPRERALAQAFAERESARWRPLIAEARLEEGSSRRAPRLRPVGRDQQWLQYDRPLSRAESQAIQARLAARPEVEWVEPSTRERRLQAPDDPYFAAGMQWWLLPVAGTDGNLLRDRRRGVPGFQSAWLQPGGTGASAVVAVLDTGITPHPDLAGRVLPGYDFVSDAKFGADGDGRDDDPADPGDGVTPADLADGHFAGCGVAASSWHGTVIAGIAAGATNNGLGAAAISWNGRVLPVRVAGKCGADLADIVEGMRWAAGLPACRRDDGNGQCLEFAPTNPNPARIVNISFGGSSACGAAYQAAVDELKAAGVVVVAAGGNEHGAATRPANCSGVVGVVGLARDGFKTHYSNFGADFAANGIATVGGDDGGDPAARWNPLADEGILAIGNHGTSGRSAADFAPGYFHFWGTSFSAPIVAGAISLMLGVNPALSHAQIVDGLRRGARPHVVSSKIGLCSNANPGRCICTTATCGAGILDAEQALLFAADPAAYVAPARTPAVIEPPDLVPLVAQYAQDRPANPTVVAPSAAVGNAGGGAASWPWLAALAGASRALSARRHCGLARRRG